MSEEIKVPKVRIAKPKGRPIQLRYTDPDTTREVRITTETYDEAEALEQKKALEAKLLLGIDAKPRKRTGGPSMRWEDFRERYTELQLSGLRERSASCAESRLDIVERILKPRLLTDVANSEALHELQKRLRDGDEGRGPRAKFTVRSYMAVVMAALNWAVYMQWLAAVPKLKKIDVAKLRKRKGRALTDREFRRLLFKTRKTVGREATPSWRYVLRAAWESGLRLEELMHLHWTDERFIVPKWIDGALPVLAIPAEMQKNETEESIPLLPGFESLLLETPEAQRFGWVLNPISLQTKLGRGVRHQRPDAEWVGKVISRIGKAAGIVVQPAKGGKKEKYASAHDLRRSCARRLRKAGTPLEEISRLLRHADIETTLRYYAEEDDVQEAAKVVRDALNVPRYNVVA
jgi:integrase